MTELIVDADTKPEITRVSVDFCQPGNTLRTTDDYENLNVSLEFQLCEDDGAFVVLKTDGWSINDAEEDLVPLIKRVHQILKHS